MFRHAISRHFLVIFFLAGSPCPHLHLIHPHLRTGPPAALPLAVCLEPLSLLSLPLRARGLCSASAYMQPPFEPALPSPLHHHYPLPGSRTRGPREASPGVAWPARPNFMPAPPRLPTLDLSRAVFEFRNSGECAKHALELASCLMHSPLYSHAVSPTGVRFHLVHPITGSQPCTAATRLVELAETLLER